VYIDLYDIVDEMDFAQSLYNAVIEAMPFSLEDKLTKLASYFTRLEGVSMTPTRSLDGFSVKPNVRGQDFDELLQSAIDGLSKLCTKNNYTHAVLAFDEFQQIKEVKNVKIDAKLRAISQKNKHVCFIFSGSKKNMLREIINGKGKPFQGMTTPLTIKGIDIKELQYFCEGKLKTNFQGDSFNTLYDMFRGQTRLILQMCYRLYAESIKPIKQTDIVDTLNSLLYDYEDEFKERFIRLAKRQKQATKAIILSNSNKIYGKIILDTVGVSKQGLSQALNSLEEQDEITKIEEGSYQINDVLFEHWLKRKFC